MDKIITHKKWRDTLNVRLGGDYNLIEDRLWLRAGGFFETPAVKKEYAYVDFFSFLRFGPAAGLTVSFNNISISFAYTFVFQMPLKVTEDESAIFQQTPASQCQDPYTDESRCHHKYLGKPSAPANAGVYKANYHFFSSGISLKL